MSKMVSGEKNFELTAVRKTVIGTKSRSGRWLFKCECGSEIEAIVYNVRSGHTSSCGCLRQETISRRNHKHGQARSMEFRAWLRMRARVKSTEPHKRAAYLDRGIGVCPEWQNDFQAFLKFIGPAPSPQHSLDRIDNDCWYEPGNVRWATRSEQMKNRRPFKRRKPAQGDSFGAEADEAA